MTKLGCGVYLVCAVAIARVGLLPPADGTLWDAVLFLSPAVVCTAVVFFLTRTTVGNIDLAVADKRETYHRLYGTTSKGERFLRGHSAGILDDHHSGQIGSGLGKVVGATGALDALDAFGEFADEAENLVGEGMGLVVRGGVAIAGELLDRATKPAEQRRLEAEIGALESQREEVNTGVATFGVGSVVISVGALLFSLNGGGGYRWDEGRTAEAPQVTPPTPQVESTPTLEPPVAIPPSPHAASKAPPTKVILPPPEPEAEPAAGPPAIAHRVPSLVSLGEDVELRASVEGTGCSARLWYLLDDEWSLRRMEAGPDGSFAAVLPVKDGMGSRLRYYITAECESGQAQSGSQDVPHGAVVL